jgi:hypothetical protein
MRPRFINRIDWGLLKKQKASLLDVIETISSKDNEQKKDDLTGILHLIDAIQDYAVDSMGLQEDEVF